MKNAYPIILTPGNDGYVVFIPDFGIGTQGKDLTEAIEMARDAIGLMGIDFEDDGKAVPQPCKPDKVSAASGEIVTLVDVDFSEYRRRNEMRTVRKNLSLPSWLNERAEAAHINFSAVLQEALKSKLNIV